MYWNLISIGFAQKYYKLLFVVIRMNTEVTKSEQKLAKLHAELGKANVAAWQAEHAAEVLTAEQLKHMGLQQTS